MLEHASRARSDLRSLAALQVSVDELPAHADALVVVQVKQDGHASCLRDFWKTESQVSEMVDVNHVDLALREHCVECRCDRGHGEMISKPGRFGAGIRPNPEGVRPVLELLEGAVMGSVACENGVTRGACQGVHIALRASATITDAGRIVNQVQCPQSFQSTYLRQEMMVARLELVDMAFKPRGGATGSPSSSRQLRKQCINASMSPVL